MFTAEPTFGAIDRRARSKVVAIGPLVPRRFIAP